MCRRPFPWVRTGLQGLPDALNLTYYGIDLADGLAVLVLGVAMLICLAVARVTHGTAARVAAGLLIAASILAIVVSGASAITAADRFTSECRRRRARRPGAGGHRDPGPARAGRGADAVRLAQGPFVALGGALLGRRGAS